MSNSAFNRICHLSNHQQNAKSLFDFEWHPFRDKLMEAIELNFTKLKILRTDDAPCIVIGRFVYIQADVKTFGHKETKPQIHLYLAKVLLDANNATITRTHQQIADELGTAREVVSRQLKRLELKGAVSLGRGHIEITDRKTLEKMALA